MKMNRVKVTLTSGTDQLHWLVNSPDIQDCCAHSVEVFASSLVMGSQNTGKPVSHADAQMYCQGGRRNQPAIEAGFGNSVYSIQHSRCAWCS